MIPSLKITSDSSSKSRFSVPRIVVIGVGGAGGNAVNNMIKNGLEGVEFLAANTDAQSLAQSLAPTKIQLGSQLTKGMGAGAVPSVGQKAAGESRTEIEAAIKDASMLFITAGMGGGTGTGAGPEIAKIAKEKDILTVGVITKPFLFEGANRMNLAESGIKEMQKYVDTLIVIPNQNLFRVANEKTGFMESFQIADSVLHAGVKGVTDLITMPGLINLDFADVKAIMRRMGKAMMGSGEASGEDRAIKAADIAITNPLLDSTSMRGARGALINITSGADMTLFEVEDAVNRIRSEIEDDANIIFGAIFNPNMEGTIRVSVVATGIDPELIKKHEEEDNRAAGHVSPLPIPNIMKERIPAGNGGKELPTRPETAGSGSKYYNAPSNVFNAPRSDLHQNVAPASQAQLNIEGAKRELDSEVEYTFNKAPTPLTANSGIKRSPNNVHPLNKSGRPTHAVNLHPTAPSHMAINDEEEQYNLGFDGGFVMPETKQIDYKAQFYKSNSNVENELHLEKNNLSGADKERDKLLMSHENNDIAIVPSFESLGSNAKYRDAMEHSPSLLNPHKSEEGAGDNGMNISIASNNEGGNSRGGGLFGLIKSRFLKTSSAEQGAENDYDFTKKKVNNQAAGWSGKDESEGEISSYDCIIHQEKLFANGG